jgi:hypothetical protein
MTKSVPFQAAVQQPTTAEVADYLSDRNYKPSGDAAKAFEARFYTQSKAGTAPK